MNAHPDVWEGYSSSLIEIDIGSESVLRLTPGPAHDGSWPYVRRVWIVTAANPGSSRLSNRENARRNRELRDGLDHDGAAWRYAVGYSSDESWVELSYALLDSDAERALTVARRFGQASVFACSATSVDVMAWDGTIRSTRHRTVHAVDWNASVLRRVLAAHAPEEP